MYFVTVSPVGVREPPADTVLGVGEPLQGSLEEEAEPDDEGEQRDRRQDRPDQQVLQGRADGGTALVIVPAGEERHRFS
jgi:hypothetical protein